MKRRGLPKAPGFVFTGVSPVERPKHDCAQRGHIWKKTLTVWPGEKQERQTQTCEECGFLMGRTIR